MPLRLVKIAVGVIAIFVLFLIGIVVYHNAVVQLNFSPLDSDGRVYYDKGAEGLAQQASGYLTESIAVVEKEQHRHFVKPIKIYVCATDDSFKMYTGISARGCTKNNKLFLSGKLKQPEYNESVKRILIHELSHLHFQQQLNSQFTVIPSWFNEGWAVIVSHGGGAETVDETTAAKAIIEGKYFTPEEEGGIILKNPASYGLKPHMYYRQAAMFVGYLRSLDENKFNAFLLALEDGHDFKESFNLYFDMSVDKAWQQFVGKLKKDNN